MGQFPIGQRHKLYNAGKLKLKSMSFTETVCSDEPFHVAKREGEPLSGGAPAPVPPCGWATKKITPLTCCYRQFCPILSSSVVWLWFWWINCTISTYRHIHVQILYNITPLGLTFLRSHYTIKKGTSVAVEETQYIWQTNHWKQRHGLASPHCQKVWQISGVYPTVDVPSRSKCTQSKHSYCRLNKPIQTRCTF